MTDSLGSGSKIEGAGSEHGRRARPRAVRLLLPVWGYRYIRQFLDFSLPTLLAPGNLPAVAGMLPTTFVLLTSSDDAERLAVHPGYQALAAACATQIEVIDDLITGDNYSTTITLAFERAVRATGPDLTDTCFVFLVSDYLMADGSLQSAVARVLAGASGVLAGNFQVIQEEAAPEFHERFASPGPALSIASRDLMGWALAHLHPMTVANMVSFPLSHAAHCNRLFWQVEASTLIGRFYLMHMICIRPECTDFVIGSSCDYSFIPEMCPSGAIDTLTDSDEYLVVEMQPRDHERSLLRMGAVEPIRLAATLSEWTTAQHRRNAHATLVFHAEELPAALPQAIAEADRFVETVAARLSRLPQPHRGHHYWVGAIAAHRWALKRLHRASEAKTGGVDLATPWSLQRVIQELRVIVFGRPPFVRPWHPRWPDYRQFVEQLKMMLTKAQGTLLIVGNNTVYLRGWLSQLTTDTRVLQPRELTDLDRASHTARKGEFQNAIVLINEEELRLCGKLVDRVMPLLAEDGLLLLAVINGRAKAMDDAFAGDFACWSSQFADAQNWMAWTRLVPVSRWRASVLSLLVWLNNVVLDHPYLAPLLAVPAALLTFASYVANKVAAHFPTRSAQAYSSASIVFRAREWPRRPVFEQDQILYWDSWWAKPAPVKRAARAGDV